MISGSNSRELNPKRKDPNNNLKLNRKTSTSLAAASPEIYADENLQTDTPFESLPPASSLNSSQTECDA